MKVKNAFHAVEKRIEMAEIAANDAMDNAIDHLEYHKQETLTQLFPKEFMQAHSAYDTIFDLMEHAGLPVSYKEDFGDYTKEELDTAMQKETDFDSWEACLREAAYQFVKREYGF